MVLVCILLVLMNNMHAHIICISTRIPSSPPLLLVYQYQGKGFDSTKQLLLLLVLTRVVVCILASTRLVVCKVKRIDCAHSRVHQMTGKFSLFLTTFLYRYVTCPESTTLHHQSSNKPQPWVPIFRLGSCGVANLFGLRVVDLCELSMRTTS